MRRRHPCRRAERGVTLLELMIVVVVVAILAVVVLPSYQGYVTKARRTDAKMALTREAQALERWSTERGTYLNFVLSRGGLSDNDHYLLSFESRTASAYKLRAVPQGAQANDTACANLTIDQNGIRAATGPKGLECWQ